MPLQLTVHAASFLGSALLYACPTGGWATAIFGLPELPPVFASPLICIKVAKCSTLFARRAPAREIAHPCVPLPTDCGTLGEAGLGTPRLARVSLLMDGAEAPCWLPHPESEYGNLNADNTSSK